jgi:membrane associated rhomboid family serine protease
MLLLPLRDKVAAAQLPWVALLVALACVVVYGGLQGADATRTARAYEFYTESGLDGIELPRYQAYLAARMDGTSAQRLHLLQNAADARAGAQLIQGDDRFLDRLHGRNTRADPVVPESDPLYARWSKARGHFEELLGATATARYGLSRAQGTEVWRFLTYAFLHPGPGALLCSVALVLLIGPFVEAVLGHARFALAYLGGAAVAGGLHILVSDTEITGAAGALAAVVGMLLALYGARTVPVYFGVVKVVRSFRFPPLALVPVWLAAEVYQWSERARLPLSDATLSYGAHAAALCAGALIAWVLRPAEVAPSSSGRRSWDPPRRTETGSSLAAQAQDAAARLDIRRATRLYRELVELEPARTDYLGAYLNVALLGADEEALQDAALRLLWNKLRTPTDDLRKTFLQLTQPKVLKALPIDEHLRLARRLVRFREDSAALRVIDALLRDEHLRELYGRQLADCLLGLFTAYVRHGLQKQAEQIQSRLSSYFPSADQIGGVAPANRPPSTLFTSLRPTVAGLALPQADSRLGRPPPATLNDETEL